MKHIPLIRLLVCETAMLTVVAAFLAFPLSKLSSLNLFSKNIDVYDSYPCADEDSDNSRSGERDSAEIEYDLEYYGGEAAVLGEFPSKGNGANCDESGDVSLDVPYVSQNGVLPNGCEAVCAVMLLKYCGVDADASEFCDKYLEKGDVYVKWGCRYGPNPRDCYAGDPKSETGGWGCFFPAIVNAVNKYLTDNGYNDLLAVRGLPGTSLDDLIEKYVKNEIPVAVWANQNMQPSDFYYTWLSYDSSETFVYPASEHCVVLTGCEGDYYIVNDPIVGKDTKYKKSDVKKCYSLLGEQAVIVTEQLA